MTRDGLPAAVMPAVEFKNDPKAVLDGARTVMLLRPLRVWRRDGLAAMSA